MTEKPRILIVDDDVNLRKTLADILKVKGYEAASAKNGIEGCEALNSNSFAVVLLDLRLPDMSGLEVLKKVKAEHPATQTIILTGNASLESAIEATNKGAFTYLQKPYEIDQLLLHIRRAIEKQQADDKIIGHNAELRRINAELKALYQIALVISRTMDMNLLFSEVLGILMEMEIFRIERKGSIFLLRENRLKLASSVGIAQADLGTCGSVNDAGCLCGLAATSGEIVVSPNSQRDQRHAGNCGEPSVHGHIIVPLKTVNRVVGVLCLYTEPDRELDERTVNLFISIGNQLGIAIENATLYEEAKASSLHDHLTGLANRRFLQIQMEKSLDAVRRYREALSVIMVDIDRFKEYNDTNGHVEGDRLLVALAAILLKTARSADTVFRYGGEEFLLLLPKTDVAMASLVAERLRMTVEAETKVTISLGVATSLDGYERNIIASADKALYRAKQNGRNRVEVG